MPKRSPISLDAPLQTIRMACYLTGESQSSIRAGIKAGRIPHVVRGTTYLVNLPLYRAMLQKEAEASVRGAGHD